MSSNKNWPSMFKSKPCNNTHNHQHDNDTPSYMHHSNCNISSSFSADRVPDPKPRWNPKPEQIRILESIFNSGIVNPPREEIQKIRTRLQEFGQIGDANVFYWFQNRKSRAKHKLRVLQKNPKTSKKDKIIIPSSSNNNDVESCFGLVNHEPGLFPVQNNDLVISEPTGLVFPVQNDPNFTTHAGGFGFDDFNLPVVTEEVGQVSTVNNGVNFEIPDINFDGAGNSYSPVLVSDPAPLTMNQSQGVPENVILPGGGDFGGGNLIGDSVLPTKLTVFINDILFEVVPGLFNVREAFGNDAVLMNSFGQPISTDELGFTFEPLQNGAVYYLI